jgi:antitoxin component YwqK of YwqJK toxin-antitoxin module
MEISTVYGVLYGCIDPEFYESGNLKSTRFDKENNILTEIGLLIPQYTDDNVRRKYSSSVTFYENGNLKSISLEKQTEVLTPLGRLPAELITFYEDGSVKRVFPLNGKISGYWSESDEAELARPMSFEFNFGEFSAKIMCVYFYNSGRVKSITLFPNEVIELAAPIGKIKVRTGFSLYESGRLKSVEPAVPVAADTPIGKLTAYDSGAIGINGDINSLTFKEDGRIESLKLSDEEIIVKSNDNIVDIIKSSLMQNPLDEEDFILMPFSVKFEDGIVLFEDEVKHSYFIDETKFTVVKSRFSLNGAACKSCSGCSSCSSCR